MGALANIWKVIVALGAIGITFPELWSFVHGRLDRRGFKIDAAVESGDNSPNVKAEIVFELLGEHARAIHDIRLVVRPRFWLERAAHGGWAVRGPRSVRYVEAVGDANNPPLPCNVKDQTVRQFGYYIDRTTADLPNRWQWPWDHHGTTRWPRARELRFECELRRGRLVYVKPSLVKDGVINEKPHRTLP